MDFLYRNATPAYKGTKSQPAKSGLFSGLSNLLGGATPNYKTVEQRGAQASTPARGWWQAFVTTPSYKTASAAHTEGRSDESSTSDTRQASETAENSGCEANHIVIL